MTRYRIDWIANTATLVDDGTGRRIATFEGDVDVRDCNLVAAAPELRDAVEDAIEEIEVAVEDDMPEDTASELRKLLVRLRDVSRLVS